MIGAHSAVLPPCSIPTYFFFFNDTATTEIYTLSLHDALPISSRFRGGRCRSWSSTRRCTFRRATRDRKSTRLNSSHGYISYAVFCLKKKKKTYTQQEQLSNIQINQTMLPSGSRVTEEPIATSA